MAAPPTVVDLFQQAQRSAWHLEMRDGYMRSDPVFQAWQAGEQFTADSLPDAYRPWHGIVGEARSRGVEVHRARVVSEPVSEYIRFEHEITDAVNVAAGEQVRWLPRQHASDLLLPGNDLWCFDQETVQFGFFNGDGEVTGHGIVTDPVVVQMCVSAFRAVWERAVPHEEYKPA